MEIVYADPRIVVAVKPAGVLSTDEPGGMPQLLRQELGTPCIRTVHRLDAAVSGLMVYARSAKAASLLSEQLRSRTFGNDHMVRIYQGRLRLGFDTRQLRPDWFRAEGDSIAHLTLPPVGLLDENFIDEARTRTFYEKGTCPPDTLERLYHTAQQRMRQRGLSARHLHDAEENARRQFTQIFQALGYSQCHITFKK